MAGPEKLWFRPTGWGFTPCRREGWIFLAVAVPSFLISAAYANARWGVHGRLFTLPLLVVFGLIVRQKSEPRDR